MPTPDQLDLAGRLLRELPLGLPVGKRLRGARIALSATVAAVRASLAGDPFFPPGIRPEMLGDGALIERRGAFHFLVHERHEVAQLRYSAHSTRTCFSLRCAVRRYLKHYASRLRGDAIAVRWWR